MKNFKKNIIEKVIEPNSRMKLSNAKAQVLNYDHINNLADVCLEIASIGGKQIIKNVPIQISANGIHQSSLQEGDYVYIQFNNNSIFQPKIIGKADELYATHTRKNERHLKQGCLQVTQDFINEEITPSTDKWIEPNNINKTKYLKYKDGNPLNDMAQKINSQGYFQDKEVGMYNPASSSIMKIKDNGNIDLFIDTNIGIRINAENKTIEFLGNQTTKSSKWTVLSNNVEIIADEKINIKTKELVIDAEKIIRNGEEINV